MGCSGYGRQLCRWMEAQRGSKGFPSELAQCSMNLNNLSGDSKTMAAGFTKEAWLGGFYKLALEYETPSSARLQEAVKTIWNSPGAQGCYLLPDVAPTTQERVAPAPATLESHRHLLGVATLPNAKQVPCGTYLVQEETGIAWIGFYVPMGALGTAYDVGGYPFESN